MPENCVCSLTERSRTLSHGARATSHLLAGHSAATERGASPAAVIPEYGGRADWVPQVCSCIIYIQGDSVVRSSQPSGVIFETLISGSTFTDLTIGLNGDDLCDDIYDATCDDISDLQDH
ncbi:hypothetical protein NDU88_005216 [Pleurodeles waltl]|uniref:Uncharacterized protein n=1 Tax=Pleurodeles waltl TaxID=8319 RepID=A0AAV7LNX3_PLEWA|nr:hypothetical protein NDU88_005216 [Pleurodeles waltl]